MYPYIKCPTCNNEIGSVYELFKHMRKIQNESPQPDLNLLEIFELLHIKNVCCRNRLQNVREFNPFLHSDEY